MSTEPKISKIEIKQIDLDGKKVTQVKVFWAEVDREDGGGWILPAGKIQLAERLKAALFAGAIWKNRRILTDIYGKTYVEHGHEIRGRALDADLKRLGF